MRADLAVDRYPQIAEKRVCLLREVDAKADFPPCGVRSHESWARAPPLAFENRSPKGTPHGQRSRA